MYHRCNECGVGIGHDMTDEKFRGLGHICNPRNPHILRSARQLGDDPVAYVARVCDVSPEDVLEFWETDK